MSLLNILYSILIMPLQLFFEIVFMMVNRQINNPGLSIIGLSLTMNFLVLPLYKRADAMQEEERDIEAKLHDGVKHIKKTFKGDERMMILNTYYRQNDYKPTYVFRGALSLFLEIPFFIAAYQFLSHLELLQGVAFGPLRDLGAVDALLMIGNFHINILPVVMTSVNLVSCAIFTKGYPAKTKIQLYSMAIFFFFFLYYSPSGLVFYWTLNNIFSLVKTIFYRLKYAKRILQYLFAIVGVGIIGATLKYGATYSIAHLIVMLGIGIVFVIPLIFSKIPKNDKSKSYIINHKIFYAGALYLSLLVGGSIPSNVISSSPQEFVDIYFYHNPVWYVCSAMCLAIGIFVVWSFVFYCLADDKAKYYINLIVWCICGIGTMNYMFFGKKLGLLNSILNYENPMVYSKKEQLFNIISLFTAVVILLLAYKFLKKYLSRFLFVASIALMCMVISNVVHIEQSLIGIENRVEEAKQEMPHFSLSKNGKNVIVLMLDRGINEFIPYFVHEKPELRNIYDGFTYYENTLSYGAYTNFATPSLFGGYEYTPYELNLRDEESLKDKQNEALKVMPVLFEKNGFEVTVCDPTYANYQWIPDLAIYNEYPDIRVYNTTGMFNTEEGKQYVITISRRNFFCYGLMKILPLSIQPIFYDSGNYNNSKELSYAGEQTFENQYIAHGTMTGFISAYSVLQNLSSMTNIEEEDKNTFLMMTNDTTHECMMLQEPEYVPAAYVDNTAYESENACRTADNGDVIHLETLTQYIHYQSDMAALLEIGKWLDYLRQNEIYDNTRIIIVADHGTSLQLNKEMVMDDGSNELYDLEMYYPLLMVKDFDSHGFTTSEQFMTNADVPKLATDDILKDYINPFTGNRINNDKKYEKNQYVFGSSEHVVDKNNGNQFLPGMWFVVHDDMRYKDNWTVLKENSVLPFP